MMMPAIISAVEDGASMAAATSMRHNPSTEIGSATVPDAAHPTTTIFVWNVAYPYHTSMENSARDGSIDVQYVCSRARSALISTAHFCACPTFLP